MARSLLLVAHGCAPLVVVSNDANSLESSLNTHDVVLDVERADDVPHRDARAEFAAVSDVSIEPEQPRPTATTFCGRTENAWNTPLATPIPPRAGATDWFPSRSFSGPRIAGINVTGPGSGGCVSEFNFTARAFFADGSTVDVTEFAHWHSSNGHVLVVQPGAPAGRFTGRGAGSVFVSATIDAVEGRSSSIWVNCDRAIQLNVDRIDHPLMPCIPTALSVHFLFPDGTMLNAEGHTLLWGTSDGSIAVLNTRGEVLGLRSGTAQIVAGNSYLRSAPITVTVP